MRNICRQSSHTISNVLSRHRLIEHGPSRSTSPVLYYDPQASTLLELLRNISEEVEEYDPQSETAEPTASGAPSLPSPVATLSEQLRKLSSRQSSPNPPVRGPMGNILTKVKAKSLEPPAATKVQPSPRKSHSLDDRSRSTSPSRTNMIHIPSIQISRTESQQGLKALITDESGRPDTDELPAVAPKVTKRKAPEHPLARSTSPPTDRDRSISPISRPIPSGRPAISVGLIAPPPGRNSCDGESDATGRAGRSRSRSPSPACLRPLRKIEDVTTVKRAPKNGWL